MATPDKFEETAQKLTTKIENRENVSAELNAMPFDLRMRTARRMDEINAEHVAKNSSLPDLQIISEKDSGGQEHLTDMQTVESGHYVGIFDRDTNVYDLPAVAQKNMWDNVKDTRLARDREHSKFMTDEDAPIAFDGSGEK